ncbi:hypothetical protein ACOSQ4_003982 [Xanthoceras sorbifolium]
MEGRLVCYLHLPSVSVLWGICRFVASLICKGCKLVGKHKERALALFFFVMEAVSVVLDLIGKNKEVFLLATFLLSAFGFTITLYACVEEKTNTKTMAERQLKAVEIVFLVIQLVVTFIQFLLTVLQVKNNYNASAFPLAFAMIAIVFIFKKGGNIDGDHSPPREFDLPLVNFQPLDSHVPNSTPIELDLTETSLPNQVNPLSSSLRRSALASVVLPKNIELLVPQYGVQRAIDLVMFTCYEELYKELKNMFSIRLYFNKRPKSHWELIYADDNGDMFSVGDDSWEDFYHKVRKLYLYKNKSLRNNFMAEPRRLIHKVVSPPPAQLPARQQTIMEPVAAYDPRSPHLIDIDIEVASTLNSEKTAPPPPALVSLDLLKADSEGEFLRLTQAEIMEAGDVNGRPRLITSNLKASYI